MNEKDQQFVSYVWIDLWWQSDDVFWNPDDFCGIQRIYLPNQLLWKLDLTIEEMTEKDKGRPSPHLLVNSNGSIILRNDMVVVSTCKMQVYQFPFDVQSCTLSLKSNIYFDNDIELVQQANSSWNIDWSRKMMRTQSEWLFLNLTIDNKIVDNFGFNQSMLVYTIKMRRRSALYIVNFLVPILFFLCLDLASFLISDRGGEKLSFKVTVLLAITVMQLILNEILPSSSDRIPLIAVYCIGIFGLMMLSLLETILVMYLVEKDNEADKDQSLSEDYQDKQGKAGCYNCFNEVKKLTHIPSPRETPSELLSVAKESNSSQLMEGSNASENLSEDLNEAVKTLVLLLSSRKEEEKHGCWTRLAKTINKVFFIFYILGASVFFLFMYFSWNSAEHNSANYSDN